MIGCSVNQYKVTGAIGADGMGEVFRTHRRTRPLQSGRRFAQLLEN